MKCRSGALIMQWQESLRDLDSEAVQRLARYWEEHTPDWSVNDNGKRNIKKWLQQFSAAGRCKAMDAAATSYLEFNEAGKESPKTPGASPSTRSSESVESIARAKPTRKSSSCTTSVASFVGASRAISMSRKQCSTSRTLVAGTCRFRSFPLWLGR
jgi:cobalamin biosynthesis Mg chelatase CobN